MVPASGSWQRLNSHCNDPCGAGVWLASMHLLFICSRVKPIQH
ncbi:MAG: hypothetical protein GY774_31895 [Planctomycetes bacterium]|nr:hypothetical protein [Planctomycetota bacterium]